MTYRSVFAAACLAFALLSGSVTAQKKSRPESTNPQWVWLQKKSGTAEPRAYFRKEFDGGGVSSARLYATCDNEMKVFIDGKLVLQSSEWEMPLFKDVSKEIDLDSPNKKHVIAVECRNEGSVGGLMVRLDFESGWRDAWSLVSDESWLGSTKPQAGWKTVGFKPNETWRKPDVIAPLGKGPWASRVNKRSLAAAATLKEPTATPVETMKVAKGFKVDLLYSVPKGQQGSWVNMCVDPKGRLIVSDQYGSLYRVTTGSIKKDTKVEKINVDIGEAQGLLWAFDSLYVNVNRGKQYPGGLYRVRDTDGDDQLDSVETLRPLNGSGEHGPHAVLPHPDGKSLVVICGNRTDLTEIATSRVPQTWDEDRLIPRPTGRFMRGTRAPGGYVCRIDPDGKQWELMASGFRNQYDAGYNAEGELFTYDADMEWDLNTPWYRPTRICHVVSGAEFGWRSGGGKWPVYYSDSVPPVINIGPGSPTGTTFGYNAKFPAKYQKAFYASDWSFGKLYAVHLKPDGSTYTAEKEEFVSGTPLPLTDVIVNPADGAMYFLIGGRRVQSGLYRVTYTGSESTAKADYVNKENADLRATRRSLEELHAGDHPDAVAKAWPHLGSEDRFIRYAARVAIEHRPVDEWKPRLLLEKDTKRLLAGLMALARTQKRANMGTNPDIDSAIPDWENLPAVSRDRAALRDLIVGKVAQMMATSSDPSEEEVLETLRVLTLTFLRVAPPTEDFKSLLANGLLSKNFKFNFPTSSYKLNSELAYMLVYLQVPEATERIVNLLLEAPTQEEQIDLAASLRHMKAGWTPDLREKYFGWFVRALSYRGGASFNTFVTRIRDEAIATLTAEQKESLKEILNKKPDTEIAFSSKPRKMVKKWTMEELVPIMETKLKNRDFNHGRRMFAEAKCFACHRFDNQGGTVGPDLTSLAGRFSSRDILESVLDPNKQISDQYEAVQILTVDGKVITGRIANLAGDSIRLQTNMLDPGSLVGVDRKLIEEMQPSKASMMPEGLLNTMNEDEVLDLMAYLLSRGDSGHAMFTRD